tara:strand:+ start:84 stop:233 length:150 start_codon:yes stop_codon:yes gene_type:complete
MNKSKMLADRILELSDKDKRDIVWDLMDEKTKGAIKDLINQLAVKMNDR